MTLDEAEPLLLYKVIAGSTAYGLKTSTSDIDTRGVFMLPNYHFYGLLDYPTEVSCEKHDNTYFELNRFANLIIKNDANILELLYADNKNVLLLSPIFKRLIDNRDSFLTRKIKFTFGNYGISQINKATGTNKKINNPMEVTRKSVIDFCYIVNKDNGYMVPAKKWLEDNKLQQEQIGLSELPNGTQSYKVYVSDSSVKFNGICTENANQVKHSEIPKDYPLTAFLNFNLNGYSAYSKKYKEYREWLKNRNEARYNDNIKNGQNYDGKNMMHCTRLLTMAVEILEGKGVNLIRNDRDFLLSIKYGEMNYDDIMGIVNDKMKELEYAYKNTDLPENVDSNFLNQLIIDIRNGK